MKSQIPWTNFCMRKYGGSIHRKITDIALMVGFAERLGRDFKTAQQLKDRGCWVNIGKPLSDAPLKERSGKDRRK